MNFECVILGINELFFFHFLSCLIFVYAFCFWDGLEDVIKEIGLELVATLSRSTNQKIIIGLENVGLCLMLNIVTSIIILLFFFFSVLFFFSFWSDEFFFNSQAFTYDIFL
jgi:hypothetical protein